MNAQPSLLPIALLSLALSALPACDRSATEHAAPALSHAPSAVKEGAPASLKQDAWPLPAITVPAAQPDLVGARDGSLLLSWVEHGDPARGEIAHALKFARLKNGTWSA